MSDALTTASSVAVIPCFNEGRNPVELASALLDVPGLDLLFLDDGSEDESAAVFEELAARGEARVHIVRCGSRRGKVAVLLDAMRSLGASVERVLLVDCDVRVDGAAARIVIEELGRSDLVMANAMAQPPARTWWQRGAIFSANRHARLRDARFDRYPALCCNGRLLGMRRRLVDAIAGGEVPRHTEDAHFMLVCLKRGYRYAFRGDARLWYRAPETLEEYLRQSNRYGEGRALLAQQWSEADLARWYDPVAADLARTFAAQALRDPLGAGVFLAMLAAKGVQPRRARTQRAAWATSPSTKVLR